MKPLSETAAKRQLAQLQTAILEGLEDVKAQNIQVFDTTHLTPLFERVIVASGTSNRQTKALAASVRDKVREAGFAKPSIGGEDNGEWVTVDCGSIVAHIMQPAIRDYYRLEEIWGEKPVKLSKPKAAGAKADKDDADEKPAVKKTAAKTAAKKTAAKTASKTATKTATKTAAKTTTKAATKTAAEKPAAKKTAAKKAAAKTATKSATKTAATKTAAKKAATRKAGA